MENTMTVHSVKVSFQRKKQPVDYEEATPAIEFSGSIEDGQDHNEVARGLMVDAMTIAYNALGLDIPPKASAKFGLTAGETVAVTPVPKAKTASPAPAETAADVPEASAELTRGQKAAATRAANKKRKEESAAADVPGDAPSAAPADDIPEDPKPAAKASNGAADNIPDTAPVPEAADAVEGDGGLSAADLGSWVATQVADKKLDVGQVKEQLVLYGVARLGEVDPGDRANFKADVEGIIAGS
jgi:hypothetical protein